MPNARLVVGTAPRLRTESLVLHRVRWAPRQFPWAEPHPSAAGGMRGEEPARPEKGCVRGWLGGCKKAWWFGG